MALIWGSPGYVLLKYLSLAPLLLILLTSKWSIWWGGWSYGPRLLADATPFLCLYLYRPLERFEARAWLRCIFASLAVLSISLHTLGVFSDGTWNTKMTHGDPNPAPLWSWVDSPPVFYAGRMLQDARQPFLAMKRRLLALPTSLDAPHKLAASYEPISLPHGSTVYANRFVDLRVKVLNTGEAVWLAEAKGDKGAVRLGWDWYKQGQHLLAWAGRASLKYDVGPGRTYEFRVQISSPPEPGDYTLQLDMVSEHVTWFAQQGHEALKLTVELVNPQGDDERGVNP
jgi:hypothetical protein